MEININDKQREIIKNIINNPSRKLTEFKKEIYKIAEKPGIQRAFNAILRTEAALKMRKPSTAPNSTSSSLSTFFKNFFYVTGIVPGIL